MITLYTSDTANGQKVELMLEECGVGYERVEVDLVGGEHLAPAFLAHNPLGKIPVLIDGDGPGGGPLVVTQSAAIVRYLARKTGVLLPHGDRAAALADQYASLVAADLSAAFSGLFQFAVLPAMSGQPAVEPAAGYFTTQAHRGLAVLDGRLAQSAWLAGAAMTYADVLAYPVAATSVRMLGADPLAAYPALRRWAAQIEHRPATRRASA